VRFANTCISLVVEHSPYRLRNLSKSSNHTCRFWAGTDESLAESRLQEVAVSDNPMHAGHRPPVRQRKPGELLWTVRKDHVTWTCELFFRGESYGWEAQIVRETDLRIGRRFILRERQSAGQSQSGRTSRRAVRYERRRNDRYQARTESPFNLPRRYSPTRTRKQIPSLRAR
jgi:hypothetical protein